jgi:hypothetical protein
MPIIIDADDRVTIHAETAPQSVVVEVQRGSKGDPGEPGSGLAWVSLSWAEYEALAVKDPDTIYDITDEVPLSL